MMALAIVRQMKEMKVRKKLAKGRSREGVERKKVRRAEKSARPANAMPRM